MIKRCLISFMIFLFAVLPMMLISIPVVAVLLHTKWDGKTTVFGNSKWGRANDHFAYPTKGFWQEFNWLVWRNPVNNFQTRAIAVKNTTPVFYDGPSYMIGDHFRGGSYELTMGKAWEFYSIKPYTIFGKRRCIRARIGWKIYQDDDAYAAFVFTVNPWKEYTGV